MLPANLLAPSPIYQSFFRVPMFGAGPPRTQAGPGQTDDKKEPGLHPMFAQRAMGESPLPNPFFPPHTGAEAFLRASLAMQQQQQLQQQQQRPSSADSSRASPVPPPPPLKFGINAILSDGRSSPSAPKSGEPLEGSFYFLHKIYKQNIYNSIFSFNYAMIDKTNKLNKTFH